MSIFHYVYVSSKRAFGADFWLDLRRALVDEGFDLYFDARSRDFVRADAWQRVSDEDWPDSGTMFLCDSPNSRQARVMLSLGSLDDNEVREMSWPEDALELLNARTAHVGLQLLFVDDEPSDFFLVLQGNIALLLDGIIDTGDRLVYPKGGVSWDHPD